MSRLQEIPLSVLDLVTIRDQGCVAEAFDQSRRLARQVDQLGFNRFWLAEHHNIDGIASAATSVLIGHIAGSTERIRVGSGGIMLPNHAPLVIAEQFGTLETLYPHRIDLGLGRAPGSDHATMRAIGRHMDAGVMDFPERLAELRRYLDEAQPGQRVKAIPGQGTHVPIWLLGSSGYSAQLAAQLGLPFAFAAQFAPGYLDEALHLYRQQFQPSEVLDEPYAMVGMPVIVADTDEQARYLGTTAQQKFLNLIRGQRTRSLPPVTRVEASPHEMAMVNQHLGAAVVGSAETVREGLETFLDRTQADELMVVTDVYDPDARAHSFELLAQLWQSPSRLSSQSV